MVSEGYKFTVIRADKSDLDVRLQMSEIFADVFSQWLVLFSKDKHKIAKAFAHMFVLDQFYVAVGIIKLPEWLRVQTVEHCQ